MSATSNTDTNPNTSVNTNKTVYVNAHPNKSTAASFEDELWTDKYRPFTADQVS